MATADDVKGYVDRFEKELDAVVKFWLAHSHDGKHGQAITSIICSTQLGMS